MSKKKVTKKVTTTIVEEEVVNTPERTEVIAILDRSGSMSRIIDDAIGGFNNYISEQKDVDGECNLTVALFDHEYNLLYDNVDIKEVDEITRDEWSPRGSTALHDAIGLTIANVEQRIKKTKKAKRPDKILVAIVTDGKENASKEYNNDDIQKLIKRKESDDWQFVYLAANQNAFDVGTNIGFAGGNTLDFNATARGSSVMFDTLNNATTMYRSKSMDSADYATFTANIMSNAVSNTDTNSNDSEDTEEK